MVTTATVRRYNRAGWVLYYRPGCKYCDALKANLPANVWEAMRKVDISVSPDLCPKVVKTVPTWVNSENDTWDGRPVFRA